MTSASRRERGSDLPTASASSGGAVFVTTRWSVVLTAGQSDTARAQTALEVLCRTYWYPLYAFARRQGRSVHDAQDLTQGFFARLLAHEYLKAASEEKGKFRTFLLVAFKRFMANEWHRQKALKRGGHQACLPLDTEIAESRYQAEPSADLSADRIYDRRWALTLLDGAMARLKDEFISAGKADEFQQLKSCLTADRGTIAYGEIAGSLRTTEGAARVAVHRLRKRFRTVFREAIAQTVDDPDQVEDEMRHLLAAMGG
jgi:RNA polymerase sigma-70 factor (ECF subfamily)